MCAVEFKQKFNYLKKGERLADMEPSIVLCGRISSIREASKKMYFYDIKRGNDKIQVLSQKQMFRSETDFTEVHLNLKLGDIVSVQGFPGRTKSNELSIISRSVKLLSACMLDIPAGRGDGKYALKDKYLRHTKRHVDLLANGAHSLEPFLIRNKVIKFLREFLDNQGFVEVETPIIVQSAGGALAQPFKTRSRVAGDAELCLRIAPELYLKQLVIGGIDKVYEIGKVFRNEGVSSVHNPEFTTCEFYNAYADYKDLMKITEIMIREMTRRVTGGTVLPSGVDVGPDFARISVISELEEMYQLVPGTFPDVNDLERVNETGRRLEDLLMFKHGMVCEIHKDHSVARNCKIVDRMIGLDIEPRCTAPTFLCDHPLAMSPLAKEHPSCNGLSQRFELFMLGKEVVNAYTELNDPDEQMRRFELQKYGHHATDDMDVDVMPIDAAYCRSLEYGLPPTAGWGMGVDRMVMMLSGRNSIRDVILFPMMAPHDK